MNYETLKASIQAVIKANGNEEITGPILQQTLIAIVNALGTGYQFLGIANSDTTLGTPDQRVYYVAFAYGTSIEIGDFTIEDEICILKYDDEWTKAQIAAIDTEPTDGSDNLVTSGGVAIAIEEALRLIENAYAKKEGVYPGIVAGSAQSLLNPVALAGSFVFRPTGGGASIGKGRAVFSELRGKSLVWNQKVSLNPSIGNSGLAGEITLTNNGDGSYTLNGTATATRNFIIYSVGVIGHAMLYSIGGNYAGLSLGDGYTGSIAGQGTFLKASVQTAHLYIYIASGTALDNVKIWPHAHDITQLFNGSVPDGYTVADFEKDFPLPYYAYNAGKVIPFAAQDYETTGLNQWDGTVVANSYVNPGTGAIAPTVNYDRSDYIPVIGGQTYYIRGFTYVYAYDAGKNFIGALTIASYLTTLPANAAYVIAHTAFQVHITDKSLYWLNVSGPRNGEYEPYKKTVLHINPPGWVDPYDNNIFPYGGMHGVGSVCDFAKVDADGYIRKATRAFGRVDLGTLGWTKVESSSAYGGYFFVSGTISDAKAGWTNKLACAKFIAISGLDPTKDNTASINSLRTVCVQCSAYTDAATFKTAMDGVYLYYELAAPVESTLDDPVKAFTDVDGSGTEAWKPDNTTDPYTAPCDVSIFYPLDIAGGVISAQSFANFCSELSTKLGAALNKTISIAATYNAATEQYGYTITIS